VCGGGGGVTLSETLNDVEVEQSAEGLISFRFTRPLVSDEDGVRNIDATQPVPFIWAQGNSWRAGQVTSRDEHTSYSSSAVRVDLQTGAVTVDKVTTCSPAPHIPSTWYPRRGRLESPVTTSAS
jgi:hypothetical protein